MISGIVDPHSMPKIVTTQPVTDEEEENMQIADEAEAFMAGVEDDIKRLFETYCSFGEPMNTRKLKSSKFVKLLRDTRLLKGSAGKVPAHLKQLDLADIDIMFKQICANANPAVAERKGISNAPSTFDQSYSSNFAFQSNLSTSKIGFKGTFANAGQTWSNMSHMNKTATFDKQSHLNEKHTQSLDRIDLPQFKQLLEMFAPKCFPQL